MKYITFNHESRAVDVGESGFEASCRETWWAWRFAWLKCFINRNRSLNLLTMAACMEPETCKVQLFPPMQTGMRASELKRRMGGRLDVVIPTMANRASVDTLRRRGAVGIWFSKEGLSACASWVYDASSQTCRALIRTLYNDGSALRASAASSDAEIIFSARRIRECCATTPPASIRYRGKTDQRRFAQPRVCHGWRAGRHAWSRHRQRLGSSPCPAFPDTTVKFRWPQFAGRSPIRQGLFPSIFSPLSIFLCEIFFGLILKMSE